MRCPVPSPDLSFQPDEHLEVYVSAYENPNHFWIQILGVRSLLLDKLTEEMNHFYNNSSPTVRKTSTIIILLNLYYQVLGFTSSPSLPFPHEKMERLVQTFGSNFICHTVQSCCSPCPALHSHIKNLLQMLVSIYSHISIIVFTFRIANIFINRSFKKEELSK